MPPTTDSLHKPSHERRQAPRAGAPRDLAMRLVGRPDVLEIRDLSASGVCCTIAQPLAVMTQVHLVLLVPRSGAAPREVPTDGVVVRCVKNSRGASPTGYEIAVFFTGLDDADRNTLASYVTAVRSAGSVA